MGIANCGGLILDGDTLVVSNKIITTTGSTATAGIASNCGGVLFDSAIFKKIGNAISDKDMAEEGVQPIIADCGGLVVDGRCFSIVNGELVFTNKSGDCNITAYAIGDNVGTISGTDITVNVPYGTDVTSLVATFTLSSGASAKVGTKAQVSGTTVNDFTNPVNYKVTSEGGAQSKTYKVTVVVAQPSTACDMLSFTINDVAGSIAPDPTESYYNVYVDLTGAVTSLSPVIEVSPNATVSPASGVAQDFTNPVMYTVTAQDSTTTKQYKVTVTTV